MVGEFDGVEVLLGAGVEADGVAELGDPEGDDDLGVELGRGVLRCDCCP